MHCNKLDKSVLCGTARMGGRRGAYRALVGKPERKRRLGRPRTRWEENIKMDLQEVGLKAWTAMI